MLQMEAPLMRMLSSSIPPPERKLSWKSQSCVTIGFDTSLGRGARAGLDWVNAQLRAREDEKRNHSVVQKLLKSKRSISELGAASGAVWLLSRQGAGARCCCIVFWGVILAEF